MAISKSINHWFFISAWICIFVSACKFASAYDHPDLGAAGVVGEEYVPQAEDEGDQYYPEAGIVYTNPALIVHKALECLNDKHIYRKCNADHRLTQNGELDVPPEYTDEYCNGPCLIETRHVLECIDGIFKRFIFYNRANLRDIRDTIEGGCSYGRKRGNFNVVKHIKYDESSANKVLFHPVFSALILAVVGFIIHEEDRKKS